MSEQLTLDELLIAHAAGKLAEPVSLLVATHLALVPDSRRRYERYEAVGGMLLDEAEPVALHDGALAHALARLEREPREPEHRRVVRKPGLWPAPLRHYLPDNIDHLRWRGYGGAFEADLQVGNADYRTRLIRVRGGKAVPQHTHEGSELTLVLEGAFRDETGRFARGDIEIADDSVDHQPVAEEGCDCICLAVTDAPLRLTGPFGRLLNPFIRI